MTRALRLLISMAMIGNCPLPRRHFPHTHDDKLEADSVLEGLGKDLDRLNGK